MVIYVINKCPRSPSLFTQIQKHLSFLTDHSVSPGDLLYQSNTTIRVRDNCSCFVHSTSFQSWIAPVNLLVVYTVVKDACCRWLACWRLVCRHRQMSNSHIATSQVALCAYSPSLAALNRFVQSAAVVSRRSNPTRQQFHWIVTALCFQTQCHYISESCRCFCVLPLHNSNGAYC